MTGRETAIRIFSDFGVLRAGGRVWDRANPRCRMASLERFQEIRKCDWHGVRARPDSNTTVRSTTAYGGLAKMI
jgi:hypothetical protein